MREMKYSGVEWIGDIPEDWETSTINTLYSVRNEKVSDSDYPPLSVTMKGIVPQLETAAKTDAHDSRKLVKKGDFAINSRSDRRGSCGISDYDGSVSLINTVLKPREEMNPIYYNWLFHSSRFSDEFYRWGHGIVDDLWTTRWQEMRSITIPSPTLSEQQSIADILDHKCTQIDALIANEEQQIAKLKAYKQSVITETVTKGLDPDVPMKDSGVEWIGEIPEHWEEIKMKYLMYIRARLGWKGLKADEYVEEGYTFIGTPNIDENGKIDWENVYYITKERYDESPEIKLSQGDVLLTKDGAGIGKCAFVDVLPKEATPNGSLAVITCNDSLYGKYLFYYLKSYYFQKYIDRLKAGMGVPHLFQSDMKDIVIPVPSQNEQQKIANYLDKKCEQIDRLIAIKQQKIEKIQQYKKSVIYEYVTGKREVST